MMQSKPYISDQERRAVLIRLANKMLEEIKKAQNIAQVMRSYKIDYRGTDVFVALDTDLFASEMRLKDFAERLTNEYKTNEQQ